MASEVANKPWERTGEDKRAYVRRMFGDITPTYDLLNSAMSMRLHHRWRADAVRGMHLKQGQTAIDLCCGTGDFALPLRKAVGENASIYGFDFCIPMLAKASEKRVPMSLSAGDACRLPIRSETADAVTIGWGLRNVPDISAALEEAYRILKPGGKFASVDMCVPRFRVMRAMSGFVFHKFVPALGALFGKREAYVYLPESTNRFVTKQQLAEMMRAAGFKNVRTATRFFGNICIHWGEK